MRIDFEDGGYIESKIDDSHQKIWITIGAKQSKNPLEMIINSAQLTREQFKNLYEDILK